MEARILAKSYFEMLESYLAEPHERHLLRAQELGRGLVSMNFPPEEVGAMHEEALERLEPVFGGYTLSVALHRTSAILLEVLMAYGLAFRKQIAELKRRESALRESEERFRSITRNVPGAIFRQELRANGSMHFPFVSHRYEELFGHSGEELMADASALGTHLHAKDYERLAHATRRSAAKLEPLDIEVRVQAPCGKKRWIATISQPRRRDNGDIVWDGLFLDVTDQKRAKQRIEYLANHDSLTDLPNRNLLNERLQRAVARGARYARPFAVMWIDLDRFKSVNDSLGHEAGDTVLKGVSERLQASVRASDTVARVGGDEFVVVLEEMHARADVNAVARKVSDALCNPYAINGHQCDIGASIGIAMYPADGEDVDTLLRQADDAIYRVKGAAHDSICFA